VAQKIRRGELLSFLQVANFVEKKGHFYTLRAFRRLREVYPRVRLVLGGDGPLRLRAQLLVRQLGLEDSVQFLGTVDENSVRRLMAEADVFVQHSVTAANGDEEGVPTVVMEAMASGLPVVSTLHAGIPELVQDGVTGYLVEERDVEKYFERLVDVLSDDGSMGRAGRERVEKHFDLKVQTVKLDALYRSILAGHDES
jgi:glycosyltransferase involved in cell wall biosynthesis